MGEGSRKGRKKKGLEEDGSGPSVAGGSLVQPAILLLLKQRRGHGYELLDRLSELGLEQRDHARVYRLLRWMESEGLVRSKWEISERGPARRVYQLTTDGERFLEELGPVLQGHRATVDEIVRQYRRLMGNGGGSGTKKKREPRSR